METCRSGLARLPALPGSSSASMPSALARLRGSASRSATFSVGPAIWPSRRRARSRAAAGSKPSSPLMMAAGRPTCAARWARRCPARPDARGGDRPPAPASPKIPDPAGHRCPPGRVPHGREAASASAWPCRSFAASQTASHRPAGSAAPHGRDPRPPDPGDGRWRRPPSPPRMGYQIPVAFALHLTAAITRPAARDEGSVRRAIAQTAPICVNEHRARGEAR